MFSKRGSAEIKVRAGLTGGWCHFFGLCHWTRYEKTSFANLLLSLSPRTEPDDEPRMTLTTQEDPILSPFKLEHDIQVSKHQFTLRPDLYEALRVNPDLQLELYVEEDLLKW